MREITPTGMIVDGIASSEFIDSAGEVLDVAGCDISDLQSGTSILNSEHNPNKDPNKVVGVVLGAHKIFSEDDCENERQLYYWNSANKDTSPSVPIIYIIGRLFDGSGHEQARSLAAQIRDHIRNKEKSIVRFSIEGTTLEKQGNRLVSTIARDCALTEKPCNRTCELGVLLDPNAEKAMAFDSSLKDSTEQTEPSVEKSEDLLLTTIKTNDLPEVVLEVVDDKINQLQNTLLEKQAIDLFKSKVLLKILSVGNSNLAPGQLTGGAALVSQNLKIKNKKSNKILNKTDAAFLDTYNEFVCRQIFNSPSNSQ